jgi:hypothetical protein
LPRACPFTHPGKQFLPLQAHGGGSPIDVPRNQGH